MCVCVCVCVYVCVCGFVVVCVCLSNNFMRKQLFSISDSLRNHFVVTEKYVWLPSYEALTHTS